MMGASLSPWRFACGTVDLAVLGGGAGARGLGIERTISAMDLARLQLMPAACRYSTSGSKSVSRDTM